MELTQGLCSETERGNKVALGARGGPNSGLDGDKADGAGG